MKAKIIRQAAFRDDGSITDQPARNEEQPQLEKQTTLDTYARDQALLNKWEGDSDK